MKKIVISPSTELYIGPNVLQSDDFSKLCAQHKVIVVADEAIKDLYAVELATKLRAQLLTIPNGERAKSLETAQNLINQLFQAGCNRDTLLIAMGGGVTTDLVGFVASIYMRGAPLILIPTTLLAMVDASIGGKTGIDTSSGKNLLGTIYYPKAIFADLNLLQTLSEQQWGCGLAEILKMGLIHAPLLWQKATQNSQDPDLILQAILAKIEIVERDPLELGVRRILNFGHTIGHALERVANYELSHGEAVAMGSVAEAHLSMSLGYLSKQQFELIEAVYRPFPFQWPPPYQRSELLSAMAFDKKRAKGEIRFVLIDRIGHAIPFEGAYCRAVTPVELESSLDWMEQWKSPR